MDPFIRSPCLDLGTFSVAFWSLVSLLICPIVLCDTGQLNNSLLNVHPVATLSTSTHTITPDSLNTLLKITRASSRRSLSNPMSVPTISITKTQTGAETSIHNSSLASNPLSISERQRAQKIHCTKKIPECTPLNENENATCFGNNLGYKSIYLHDKTYWETQSDLQKYSFLQYVPNCWKNVQPLLCAFYLPRCLIREENNNTFSSIDMIPKNICYKAREKCEIIMSGLVESKFEKEGNEWPEFLNCENTDLFYESQQFLFLQKNKNEMKKKDVSCKALEDIKDSNPERKFSRIYDHELFWSLKFNHTKGQCLSPYFLPSNVSSYHAIEGCDINCKSPQFTMDEAEKLSKAYSITSAIALVFNILAFITILIGGPMDAIFPNVHIYHIIFVTHICCILPNIFNLMVTSIAGNEKISCQDDGTRIQGRPEHFGLCSVSLFINYFFFMALVIWVMILGRVWYASVQEKNNKTLPRRNRKRSLNIGGCNIGTNFMHFLTWMVSAILSIFVVLVGQDYNAIEGDPYIGICFISYKVAPILSTFLVCVPLLLMILVLFWNCTWSFKTLSGYIRAAKSQGLKKNHVKKFVSQRIRLILFIVPLAICVLYPLAISIYDSYCAQHREDSLRFFLISKMKESMLEKGYFITANTSLHQSQISTPLNRQDPRLFLVQLLMQPFCFMIISSLVCTFAALLAWKNLIAKLYKTIEIQIKRCRYRNMDRNGIEMECKNKDEIVENKENVNEDVPKVKKLQLMAKAWAKRYDVQRTGQLSISSFDETMENDIKMKRAHPIVVGVLDSYSPSNDQGDEGSGFHSITEFNEFALALPRLIQRRNGCAGVVDLGLKPWGSVDSNLHLSRTVSIRSSRIGGYTFNSRCSSFIGGSHLGNGESQLSAYQSEFSEHLYSLHRESLRRSKGSGKAMRFVKRFSRRSMKSYDLSSKELSLQNSIESEDINVTILPAITIKQESQKTFSNDVNESEDLDNVNAKLSQIKSRLRNRQLKIPGPGSSIDVTPFEATGLSKITSMEDDHCNMDNKLIVSSRETYLSEEQSCTEICEKTQMAPESSDCKQVGVQTSLTDLSDLGRCPSMRDKSTQHDCGLLGSSNLADFHHFVTHATSTTSSSQTENNVFLPKERHIAHPSGNKGEHIDANVVRIHLVPKGNYENSTNGIASNADVKSSISDGSSSIPSSYEKHLNENITTVSMTTEKEKNVHSEGHTLTNHDGKLPTKHYVTIPFNDDNIPSLMKPFTIPMLPSSSPSHNRGRRGGILPKESDAVVHVASTLNKPRHPVLTIPPPPQTMDLNNYTTNESILRDFVPSSGFIINSNTMDELELKSRLPRNDSSINAQLQSMPDSIIRVSISTPSS